MPHSFSYSSQLIIELLYINVFNLLLAPPLLIIDFSTWIYFMTKPVVFFNRHFTPANKQRIK